MSDCNIFQSDFVNKNPYFSLFLPFSIGMEPVIEENCILHEDDDVFCGYENDGSKVVNGIVIYGLHLFKQFFTMASL